jgi:hypothetical protein
VRNLSLTSITLFVLCGLPAAAADVLTPALPAPTTPAADESATKPGMLWGTVITRGQFKPLTGKQRWELYWRQTFFSPGTYLAAMGIAASDQRNNDPYQWGQGGEAYAKRAANQFGRLALQNSIEAGGAALLKQDVRYVKCSCTGFFKRAGYAVAMNFVTLNREGKYRPAYAHYAGAVGAQYIANTWMPDGYRNWDTTLRDGGVQLAFSAGFNLLREFLPAKKK